MCAPYFIGTFSTSVADSVTKIVDIAKMKSILCESSADCIAVNNIYLTSANIASLLGDQEIGLQHFILATVLGKWDAMLKRESFVEFLECVKKGYKLKRPWRRSSFSDGKCNMCMDFFIDTLDKLRDHESADYYRLESTVTTLTCKNLDVPAIW